MSQNLKEQNNLSKLISLIQNEAKKSPKPFIVAIDGRGGSGKSTLAKELAIHFKTKIIKTDDFITFFKPEITAEEYFWDKKRFEKDVLAPLSKRQNFSYKCLRWRTGEISRIEEIGGDIEIIIVEGLHSLCKDLLSYYNFTIWVNTPLEIALERGKMRDLEKGKTEIDEIWNIFVPIQEKYIIYEKPHKKADIVIGTENKRI